MKPTNRLNKELQDILDFPRIVILDISKNPILQKLRIYLGLKGNGEQKNWEICIQSYRLSFGRQKYISRTSIADSSTLSVSISLVLTIFIEKNSQEGTYFQCSCMDNIVIIFHRSFIANFSEIEFHLETFSYIRVQRL